MLDLSVREASETDLPGILHVYTQAGIDREKSFAIEEARAQFASLARYPYYKIFVAETAGIVVGTYALIILDNLAKRGAKSGLVEDVAVLPGRQGTGIGRAMMEHAREQCRAARCYKMALSSNMRRETAHRFYDALRFERHGYSFVIEP